MSNIYNVEENINRWKNEDNQAELEVIVEEFKRGHFVHVLTKTKEFRIKHEINDALSRTLTIIDATCHGQIGELKQAAELVHHLYENEGQMSVDVYLLYGNLAFMSDFKLARKIMSDAVKELGNNESVDSKKLAQVYFVLGEAEENLKKFPRAIKYYKKGLHLLEQIDQKNELVLYLYYKLGALHSMVNDSAEAIHYLEKTLERAINSHHDITINSLVSLGKMYGNKKEYEKANRYLKKALRLFEKSSLQNKFVHAEAYTEIAYNYFDQSRYTDAVSYYEKAIAIHRKLPNYSKRELGMIYMQYAYSMEHKEEPEKLLAGIHYEKAIEQLEKVKDIDLLEAALADTIKFFDQIGNKKKKRLYENKFVQLTSEKAGMDEGRNNQILY